MSSCAYRLRTVEFAATLAPSAVATRQQRGGVLRLGRLNEYCVYSFPAQCNRCRPRLGPFCFVSPSADAFWGSEMTSVSRASVGSGAGVKKNPWNRRYCCVKDCHNHEGQPGIKFYRFPGRPYEINRRNKWIAAVRRVK
uniref:THAP-type domain-containing protein n=1 Tax=Rhipicephalus pulchellus TaxID=72859 RepID=L7LVV9_RHIPC